MNLSSAVYVGRIRHRRRTPARSFTFPLFMVYLDLSELDSVLSLTRLWGRSRFCPARFRREDYLSRDNTSIRECVLDCVQEQLAFRPSGPVRMLTHLRYFGFVFNPVTFYYCYDREEALAAIVAEITNTPWRERHSYVLDARMGTRTCANPRLLRWRFDKNFHVSPFLPMDLEYDWAFTPPGERLTVHMNLLDRRRDKTFDATLVMDRREISPGLLRGLLVRYPLMTIQVIARIHFEALVLWLKRARVYRHPARRPPGPSATPVHGSAS